MTRFATATERHPHERVPTPEPSPQRPPPPPVRASQDDGISLQTLAFASVGSATAALITSQFWSDGTVLSAAFTPVIVSLVSEGLKRPAKRISEVRTARRSSAPGSPRPAPSGGRTGAPANVRIAEPPPYRRIYRRVRPRLKPALITGAAAFLIAAVILTVPQLVGGQPLEKTTYFAPSASGESSSEDSLDGGGSEDGDGRAGERDRGAEQPRTEDSPERPSAPTDRPASPADRQAPPTATPRQGQSQQQGQSQGTSPSSPGSSKTAPAPSTGAP